MLFPDHNFSEKDYALFVKDGVFLDTGIIKILIDGFISVRWGKQQRESMPEFNALLSFLDKIKLTGKWEKFIITPHILAEFCRRFRDDFRHREDYKELVQEIFPTMIAAFGEHYSIKEKIIDKVEIGNPTIDIGDLSIYVAADDFLGSGKKAAVFTNDWGIIRKFDPNPNVLVFNFATISHNFQ